MGTNYSINGEHIGKASSLGKRKGTLFTWAIAPRKFVDIATEHAVAMAEEDLGDGEDHLLDECATCEAMCAVRNATEEDFSMIGQEFS